MSGENMKSPVEKKKLKQMRLPFAVLTSGEEKESTSPKETSTTPTLSRKRKQSASNEADNSRSKIRVTDSKENATPDTDTIEIQDSDDDERELQKVRNDNETTPTTSAAESVIHIKLPSSKKLNMDTKPSKAAQDELSDDSVVYLKEEALESVKKSKKSAKKSEKKKKKKRSGGEASCVKKNLNETEKKERDSVVAEVKGEQKDTAETESALLVEPMEVDSISSSVDEEAAEVKKDDVEEIMEDNISPIPSIAALPEDPENLHEEFSEVLSDDSDGSLNRTAPNADGTSMDSTAQKLDFSKLTPKQLARRKEQEKRRLEKEAQRQKERDLKEQQRLKDKEKREEAKRKEKEEKEEARKLEKEDRDRKRLAEQEKKDEEKRQKEDERKRQLELREEEKRVKEEERKRQVELREEEKRFKEEERKRQAEQRDEEKRKTEESKKKKELEDEIRKKRAQEALLKFFVPKKKNEATIVVEDETSKDSAESGDSTSLPKSNFMPFQMREKMKLAPCVRLQIRKDQRQVLEKDLKGNKPIQELYLALLKNGDHVPKSTGSTVTVEEKEDDDDVIVIDELEGVGEDIQMESKIVIKYRAKFLMFHENRRPAYHGTWRKKSVSVSARRPFAQDQRYFDYEVESDDEWEEEEPGESLHGSGSENDKEEEDDYEVDNDFMVPHGHLSDEELQQMDDDIAEENSPEVQKAKLKILQQEFAAEMKKKTEKIKPRLIGCIWMNGDEDEHGCSLEKKYHCSDIIWRILKTREMMTSDDGVKLEDILEPEIAEFEGEPESVAPLPKTPVQPKSQQRAKINNESVKELVKLVHGNTNNKRFIIREFQAYRLKKYHENADYQEFSLKNVEEKMLEISVYKTCPVEGPMFGKKCWFVKAEAMQEYCGNEPVKLPNEWTYILEKEIKEKKLKQSLVDGAKKEDSVEKETKPEVVAVDEPKKTTKEVVKPQPAASGKKRVALLMSVPRGQAFPEAKKSKTISQFLTNVQKPSGKPEQKQKESLDVDDVINID